MPMVTVLLLLLLFALPPELFSFLLPQALSASEPASRGMARLASFR